MAISSQPKSANNLKIMSFTLGTGKRRAKTADSQCEISKNLCLPFKKLCFVYKYKFKESVSHSISSYISSNNKNCL
jgi:hypothetical protein